MPVLLVFAFLAGVFTILSPCILPVLPFILSASTMKGKYRPLGIIVGLVASFTFFTLALTAIVHATGLSANVLRYIAITLIFIFGLVMLFPSLSDRFARMTTPLANLGQNIQPTTTESGFVGGFIYGIALGLLWTPCAGPILAAITTLVATQSITLGTVSITLAYSIGAGLPMFFIAYGGSKIVQSSRFLSQHSEGLRQFFGGLMVLTSIAIALHWDTILQQQISRIIPPVLIEDNATVKKELEKLRGQEDIFSFDETLPGEDKDYGKAPEITGITNWINSPPLSLMQLKGKVVLVDFWTYSCINCLRTLPYLEKWYADYKDDGLVIIGVHTPEFEFEKDPKNVAEAASRLGVLYPVAQDNDYKTWQAYHNHYWPAHYLIDQNGHVRMIHFGEGGYAETENAIRQLLGKAPLHMEESKITKRPITPETYLGSDRGKSYTSENSIKSDVPAEYHYTTSLKDDRVGLKGNWKVESEFILSESDESYLDINFLARRVYLVLSGSSDTPIEVTLDGKPYSKIQVDEARKYDIVTTTYGRHNLSLKIPKGIKAYAFTFGDE